MADTGTRRVWQPGHQYRMRSCGVARAGAHGVGAAEAALTGAPVDAEPAGDTREGDLLGVGKIGPQQPGGDVDDAAGEHLAEVADGANGCSSHAHSTSLR